MDIAIIGLGYVGLTTALAFDKAFRESVSCVVGCDIDNSKIKAINEKKPYFYEPGLYEMLQHHTIKTTTNIITALDENVDIAFVCVGTPSEKHGSINLEYVFSCMHDIGRALAERKNWINIILKSTVIPGTSEKCIKILEEVSGKYHGVQDGEFGFIMSPEFLREGSAFEDTYSPDKLVIGHKYQGEKENLLDWYRDFAMYSPCNYSSNNDIPDVISCNYVNAEFIKYANNSFLATKISFMNDLANVCEKVPGADITVIAEAIGKDHRISNNFLRAGLGYGGSCFGKDVKAFKKFADTKEAILNILQEVETSNGWQRRWPQLKIKEIFKDKLQNVKGSPFYGLKIAILGLAFKPGTDDMRDAPSIDIIKSLKGATIKVHDPLVRKNNLSGYSYWNISHATTAEECMQDVDAVILVTEWEEYKHLTPSDFKKAMKRPIVLDGRRIYDPKEMIKAGIEYWGVGYGRLDG